MPGTTDEEINFLHAFKVNFLFGEPKLEESQELCDL